MNPIFYPNQADDNHCLQASILIVLNSLGYPMPWNKVNKLTKYDSRYYSWTIIAASIVSELIPNTRLITGLDYAKLAELGEEYLKLHWDASWYENQKKHASPGFAREQQFAKGFKGKFELRESKAPAEEIVELLKDNLIIALIDPCMIKNQNGSSGHFVVLYKSQNGQFMYHDPGNPPIENAQVDQEIFMRAATNEFLVIPRKN